MERPRTGRLKVPLGIIYIDKSSVGCARDVGEARRRCKHLYSQASEERLGRSMSIVMAKRCNIKLTR
jgi:hypothetical protein